MKVVERFVSINGEGQKAGQLALFVRFAGCNLNCEYCDTKWANEKTVSYEEYAPCELVDIILSEGVKNITLTGGEPLLQKEMPEFLRLLEEKICEIEKESNHLMEKAIDYRIEIETNGSVDIKPFLDMGFAHVTFTVDYKTKVSGMEQYMFPDNFSNLRKEDTVKFVVGGTDELETGKTIIEKYGLLQKGCGIYFSPCFGKIDPKEMVEFLVENKLNGVNIQLQLHKYIWDPNQRGV
ncbi:MAG: putative 7-carboxy-7-deazaguanine synthase QueE [Lachnospiraceae bacterium]